MAYIWEIIHLLVFREEANILTKFSISMQKIGLLILGSPEKSQNDKRNSVHITHRVEAASHDITA